MRRFCISAFLILSVVIRGVASEPGLPIKIIPSAKQTDLPLVFIVSGDGGWNAFIQSVAECLTQRGMPVIGLDSRKYFWNGRSPENATEEVNNVIDTYLKRWNKKSYVLVGYSFGGCVIPFIASRTPSALKSRMDGLYSVSPDERGDFEIHVSDMLSIGTSKGKYDVIAELKKVKSLKPVCVFGNEESRELRNEFTRNGLNVIILPGNHHYNNRYCVLGDAIVKSVQSN